MKQSILLLIIASLIICNPASGMTPDQSTAPAPGQSALDDPDGQAAFALFEQHKMSEATPLLEKLAARYPDDKVIHERLGVALVSRASIWKEPEKRKADLLAARRELLRAKELGDDSPLCNVLLSQIPEDGSETVFSASAEVDAAIKRGDAALANNELDTAMKEYMLAYDLDHNLYAAALYIGDTYFRLKQSDKAGQWFARAIEIDPDRETAYRYWGDALMAAARMKEARMKFIEAVVAWPYQRIAWDGLNQWVKRNSLRYKDVNVNIPKGPTRDNKGNVNIALDFGSVSDSGSASWLMYLIERTLWMNQQFAKEYPGEKTYRHSLKEEVEALSLTVSSYEDKSGSKNTKKADKAAKPDPQLEILARLKAANMLEPFVLLMHPDEGIAKDYEAYQKAHREKLIEFLDKFLVPEAP